MILKLLCLLTLCSLCMAVKLSLLKEEYEPLGTKVNFYSEEYQNGLSHFIETLDGACKNLPRRWQGLPQSIDTRGTCGSVCTEKDCQGTCVIVYPQRGEQKLSEIGMSKKIASVQGCFVEGSQKGKV